MSLGLADLHSRFGTSFVRPKLLGTLHTSERMCISCFVQRCWLAVGMRKAFLPILQKQSEHTNPCQNQPTQLASESVHFRNRFRRDEPRHTTEDVSDADTERSEDGSLTSSSNKGSA